MHFSITLAVIASLAATTLSVPHATRNPDVNDLVTRTLPQDSTLERRTSSVQGQGADSNEMYVFSFLRVIFEFANDRPRNSEAKFFGGGWGGGAMGHGGRRL
ncbi:secreted protein [Melampsora americana]|nr:secreted protein [Melampsora americana]